MYTTTYNTTTNHHSCGCFTRGDQTSSVHCDSRRGVVRYRPQNIDNILSLVIATHPRADLPLLSHRPFFTLAGHHHDGWSIQS